jgi:2-methylisocitrate lyase-like PEP mutase family enzyme
VIAEEMPRALDARAGVATDGCVRGVLGSGVILANGQQQRGLAKLRDRRQACRGEPVRNRPVQRQARRYSVGMNTPDMTHRFARLHGEGCLLLLPNAWDAGSARLMRQLGAEAIATTSAGVAWSLGYADGDKLPPSEYEAAVRRIVRVVDCPVSADAEGGYAEHPAQVGEHVARLIGAGAVGINLEDGSGSATSLARKIEACKAVAATAGVALWVNARCDVYLRALAPGRELAETLERARLYAAAGADSLFVPGAAPEDIGALVQGQTLPLNIMARPNVPSLTELRRLGVRRLSAGSSIAQQAWATARTHGAAFLAAGSTPELFSGAAGYAEINGAFD